MKIEVDKSFFKKLERAINKFEFEVGVLDDKPHFEPVHTPLHGTPEIKSYAGGPTRKQTREKSDLTTGQILQENMKRIGTNILQEPFEKKNSDILKFADSFLKLAVGAKMSMRRVENLLQAIVRNPILKQEYGPNKASTADAKGFDRHLFDTGQMFKAIKARIKTRGK